MATSPTGPIPSVSGKKVSLSLCFILQTNMHNPPALLPRRVEFEFSHILDRPRPKQSGGTVVLSAMGSECIRLPKFNIKPFV